VILPTFDDVLTAAGRIPEVAIRTPVLTSTALDKETGAQVFLKCENLQRAGAFKIRGAFNALSQLPADQRSRGVVTFSSGNHAQAVALAARLLEMSATIVMPSDAPRAKLEATRSFGGRVILYDRHREDREALVAKLSKDQGLTLIHPYDYAHTIAGQGTVALELFDQVGSLDALFVCLGGGGLLAGSLLSAGTRSPGCRVYGVEPEAGNDGQQSLRAGSVVRIPVPKTIADGAQTTHLGNLNFAIIQSRVTDILTVSDAQLVTSLQFLASQLKLVAEPTGCLALAAVRDVGRELAGQRVGVILSGGNVDPERYAQFLVQQVPGTVPR
jgi:threo-3-hydroxy-L-aspartate ammonia-lyase